jgi:hypothetical protein
VQENMKANFFIIGAAKSGTTSLYKYLDQHPDIYFSPIKEPNYFSEDIDIKRFSSIYKKNTFLDTDLYFAGKLLPELQLTFVRNPNHYNRLFENSEEYKIKAEASTSYLYSKSAAQNIYNYNSQAKILVVLRNPIERAFSHYQMALRYGHTELGFREALEKNLNQNEKGWGISELFIELGQYSNQLSRYFEIFPKEQIKILFFDDLKLDSRSFLNDCFEFLNLESIETNTDKIYNSKKLPRTPQLNHLLTKIGAKKLIKSIVSESTKKLLVKAFYKNTEDEISKNDVKFLLDIYEDDINKTARLINRDLTSWLSY